MLGFGKKNEIAVGIDIGNYAIKVVSLTRGADKHIFTAYNIKKIPVDSSFQKKVELLQEALSEIDLDPEDINLGVSGPSIIVRFIDLPKMSKEQLSSALTFEAEKYIPFNINDVIIDSIILGDSSESGKMRVLLAAVKKDVIDERVKLARELGTAINVLDIDSFALFNAFTESNSIADNEGNAFLHFGYSQTIVLISIGDSPCFMRQIQMGGKDIIKAVAKELNVTVEAVDEMIYTNDPDKMSRITNASISVLDDIVRELQLSTGYFENRYDASIGKVYCSGGVVFVDDILKYISTKTGYEMHKWSPIENMGIADHLLRDEIERVAPQLVISLGLALRG